MICLKKIVLERIEKWREILGKKVPLAVRSGFDLAGLCLVIQENWFQMDPLDLDPIPRRDPIF